MLMKLNYRIINSIMLNLIFEDNSVKNVRLDIGDLAIISYNKDGVRKTVEGYISNIYESNNFRDCRDHWYITMTSDCNHEIARIAVDRILDAEMLKKKEQSPNVTSVEGSGRITDIKMDGATLLISQDNGATWLKVCDLPDMTPVVNEEDSELYAKVDSIVPDNIRPDLEKDLVEDIIALVKEEVAKATATADQPDTEVTEETVTDV